MVNMFGMIVGATLIPLVYWFLRTIFFYSGVSEAAPGYMYLRKAPAAGGSHGSGTGVEFRPLVIGGCLFRYGGESPRLF